MHIIRKVLFRKGHLLLLLVVALVAVACGPSGTPAAPGAIRPATSGSVSLNGAGATFPFPLYSKWFDEYAKLTGTRINYQSIGSGGGIQQVTQRTVDFGASDAPMTDEQLAAVKGGMLHIPTVLGAVVVVYNLPNVPSGLKLAPGTVSGIFLGEITKWSDQRIVSDNPDLKLPDQAIAVVHRSDGSGTTNIFTDYLSTVSAAWKSKVGKSTSVNWPVGIGGKGNEGVAGQVKQTPGSIGYVELAYATQNKLPYAFIKNKAGKFVEPTLEATSAAASAVQIPDDLRFSMVDPAGEGSYPIAGATWILVYQEQTDQAKGKALADFLTWALTSGEGMAKDLQYAPLPQTLLSRAQGKVKSITYQGQPLAP